MKDRKLDSSSSAKPKLTDAERYRRFLAAAKEVGASDDPKDFDKAFKRVVHPTIRDGERPKRA
jgi:hypothetical protein